MPSSLLGKHKKQTHFLPRKDFLKICVLQNSCWLSFLQHSRAVLCNCKAAASSSPPCCVPGCRGCSKGGQAAALFLSCAAPCPSTSGAALNHFILALPLEFSCHLKCMCKYVPEGGRWKRMQDQCSIKLDSDLKIPKCKGRVNSLTFLLPWANLHILT